MIKIHFNIPLIEEPRHVTYDWHIVRVINWLRYDNNRYLDNILVYAAVDLRIAIERYFFELLILLRYDGANTNIFTPEEIDRIRSIKGLFALMQEIDPVYRKTVRFTQIICEISPEIPPMSIMDTSYLRRKWEELSEFCHKQFEIKDTFLSPNREYQKAGFALIKEVVDKFWDNGRGRNTGLIPKQNMNQETLNIYKRYISGIIDEQQTKKEFICIKPYLESNI